MVARAHANNMMSTFNQSCPIYSHNEPTASVASEEAQGVMVFTVQHHPTTADWTQFSVSCNPYSTRTLHTTRDPVQA